MPKLTVRCYGFLLNSALNKVLIIKEKHPLYKAGKVSMIKFPGGGLEDNEGISDCLIREFYEELNVEVSSYKLVYVNDFKQISVFDNTYQVIAIYYRVTIKNLSHFEAQFKNNKLIINNLEFKWVDIQDKNIKQKLTFPIDKIAYFTLKY